MKYMGSKRRIGNELFNIIKQHSGLYGGNWVEPFVGGANMIQYVQDDMFGQWDRYANDYNQYVVACLKAYADGWRITYDNVDEDLYNDIKRDWKKGGDKYSDEIKGFVGICCSFGSKWMDGLARDSEEQRNYCNAGNRNLTKQTPLIQNINWQTGDYNNMTLPDNGIIYCDPPYANARGYGLKFNHNEFYQWCRDKKKQGYHIYISEYSMPDDFDLIHQIEITCDISKKVADKETSRIEKLFTLQ